MPALKHFLLLLVALLGTRAFFIHSARAETPATQVLAAEILPNGPEIADLAKIKLLKDLTPRLQRYTAIERRGIYLAIAVERRLLSTAEATDLLSTLGAVEGFDRAARHLCGYGSPARDGALFELRTGRAFAEAGARLVEIRRPFKGDPAKRLTDIDLVIEFPPRTLIGIECKSGTAPTDSVNADAVTLQHFMAKHPGSRAAFAFSSGPGALSRKLLTLKGIGILVGLPAEQAKALANFAIIPSPAKTEP